MESSPNASQHPTKNIRLNLWVNNRHWRSQRSRTYSKRALFSDTSTVEAPGGAPGRQACVDPSVLTDCLKGRRHTYDVDEGFFAHIFPDFELNLSLDGVLELGADGHFVFMVLKFTALEI
ncbi:hypothetical protein L2E82_35745 [Cichorium intybus]|uniref:Uncharacterized protein n=1 Tax=Cichorium intybus TaxID=13427 RepID=A0ACB9BPL6_CICIN|nr:hypothetical protein L2E82_35745 [Cichorium intybus]